MGKWVYVRQKKTKPGESGWWPQKKRMDAVKTYLATGNLVLTGKMLNIPEQTLRTWKQQEWWHELTGNLREQDNIELDSKLTKILNNTFSQMEDRIKEGDFEYDRKTGKLVRVPVKLRDLHKATSDLIDKRQVLRKQPTAITEKRETTDDHLKHLAAKFAEFVTGKQIVEHEVKEVIEGDFAIVDGTLIDAEKEDT